jgi:hypothetical protein
MTIERRKVKEKAKKIECLLCGKTYLKHTGMQSHMRTKHNIGMKKGETWQYFAERAKSPKRKKTMKRTTVTPDMQYIEVPAIIRIPISMGPIQIVSIET